MLAIAATAITAEGFVEMDQRSDLDVDVADVLEIGHEVVEADELFVDLGGPGDLPGQPGGDQRGRPRFSGNGVAQVDHVRKATGVDQFEAVGDGATGIASPGVGGWDQFQPGGEWDRRRHGGGKQVRVGVDVFAGPVELEHVDERLVADEVLEVIDGPVGHRAAKADVEVGDDQLDPSHGPSCTAVACGVVTATSPFL